MLRGVLCEDDKMGLQRAIKCAPDDKTYLAYTDKSVEWTWVKSYDEFVKHITEKGLPDLLALDHDLAPDAYKLWDKNNGYQNCDIDYTEYEHKTGYDCAKFLVDYCMDNNIKFTSQFYSHSMNPKGRQNILGILNNFKQHQENEK